MSISYLKTSISEHNSFVEWIDEQEADIFWNASMSFPAWRSTHGTDKNKNFALNTFSYRSFILLGFRIVRNKLYSCAVQYSVVLRELNSKKFSDSQK